MAPYRRACAVLLKMHWRVDVSSAGQVDASRSVKSRPVQHTLAVHLARTSTLPFIE